LILVDTSEKQLQEMVAVMIAKEKKDLEATLKKELEQRYTKAIDELKQENGELKTQMDKLNDELIVTRAECGALANEINGVKFDKKKLKGLLLQQIEEQEGKLKNMRDMLINML